MSGTPSPLDYSAARGRAATRRLSPPTQRVPLCSRELVVRSLEVARAGRLTVVVGPPGYGKTTVLAQWHERLRTQGCKAVWYAASENEREPAEFLRMLALALDVAGIDLGDAARRAINDGATENMLDAIVMGLEQVAEPAVIIIDDFERIDHPPITALVGELLEALPDGIHLTIAARRKPALAISSLRAQGSVRVIEANELRLNRDELALTLALPADALELTSIETQTEGWPVAAQLYRLWRERVSGHAIVPGFGGQASEVADYLAEQVFGALPETHQRVLIDLSIVELTEVGLADYIRDASDSAALLENIAAMMPSLIQHSMLDGESAYRLHPLLSGYANGRLALMPGRAATLHKRAADWLWRHQQHAGALRHAVQSQDEAALLAMLDGLPILEIFLGFGVSELRLILREIPPPLVETLPRIRLMSALVHFKSGLFIEAERMRAEIDRTFAAQFAADNENGRRLRRESGALELLFRVYIDGPAADPAVLVDRVQSLSHGLPLMWSWCENALVVIHQQSGDLDGAERALARAREAYRVSGASVFAELNLLCHEMLIGLAHGRLRYTQEMAAALHRRSPTNIFGEQSVHAMATITSSAIDYERSYRAQAADALRMALVEFGEGEAWFDQYAIVFPVMADVIFRRHGLAEMRKQIAHFVEVTWRRGLHCLVGTLRGIELLHVARAGDLAGDLDAAAELEEVCRRSVNGVSDPPIPWRERDMAMRALARLALARAALDEALALSDRLIEDGTAGDRLRTRLHGLILRAMACDRKGAVDRADAALLQAVGLAYPEGFVACFAVEGQAMAQLLRRAVGEGGTALEQRHVATIIRTIDGERQFAAPDALSAREAEIVAHLADGASNKLIARRLGLTDNTIKFHLKKIYVKLGVTSRTAAVARALRDS